MSWTIWEGLGSELNSLGGIRIPVEQLFFKGIRVAFNKSEDNFIAVLEGNFLVIYIFISKAGARESDGHDIIR